MTDLFNMDENPLDFYDDVLPDTSFRDEAAFGESFKYTYYNKICRKKLKNKRMFRSSYVSYSRGQRKYETVGKKTYRSCRHSDCSCG